VSGNSAHLPWKPNTGAVSKHVNRANKCMRPASLSARRMVENTRHLKLQEVAHMNTASFFTEKDDENCLKKGWNYNIDREVSRHWILRHYKKFQVPTKGP
jgi:hypothetical protein